MDPFTAALLQAGLGMGASAIGGLFGRNKGPTQQQQNQQNHIDQILAGLRGEGPYAQMFSADRETFDQMYGDPAREQFRTQTTPAIQQGYIASGQQRGTGMEDTLTRAGVNMDQMLNQQYGQYQQNAMGNQMNAINAILGYQGQPGAQSRGSAMAQGVGGYFASPQSGQDIGSIIQAILGQQGGYQSNQGRDQNLAQYFGG